MFCEVFSPGPCSPSARKLARFARGGVPGWAEVHRHQPPRGGGTGGTNPPLATSMQEPEAASQTLEV